ncbi:hypothetical protein BAE44_0013619 [Dichanthelium oligosanthes]|uniref:ABC1 atypical kinase-like domain-containing protein n=1 Tax=Dichanthelium oligosanthes TaxID=888268 RepID=A0A1E5VJQ0_9POAL|nr:hypothetical protein BAE44_0013619 [Dichanthelium oligosanthes]
MPLALAQLQDLRDRISDRLRPWSRSAQFWIRATDIYTSYKVCQLRAGFVKDEEEREAMWEQQHELGAQKMYSLCSELGGLFLKAAQILGKPDLAPMAWVKRLVTLCDNAPATPFDVVRDVVEKQFGKNFDDIFEFFDVEPVGSASIAQVHRARLKLSKTDVAVKVQHPGAEHLMMVDIQNMQAMALFLQKYDINFDLFSATKEMEKQVFSPTLKSLYFFHWSQEVLVMEFIKGTPIMNLGNEMAKRGIDPGGKIAAMAKQMAFSMQIHTQETSLSVALLDYGQVKEMPEDLRLAYANLVVAMADDDFLRAEESFRELGIKTWTIADNKLEELFQLSLRMFDTRLPPGVTVMSPFADDSSLTKIGVELRNQSKREVFSGDYFGEVEIVTIKEHRIQTFCDELAVAKSSSLRFVFTVHLYTFIYFGCVLFDSMMLLIPLLKCLFWHLDEKPSWFSFFFFYLDHIVRDSTGT